jgi:flagellar basal-body rod modification protein FlgD
MNVNPVSPGGATNVGAVPGGVDRELDRDAFLRLLLAQLENQDPVEPVRDEAFIAQLAQFSSLEQLEEISTSLETLVELTQLGLQSGPSPTPGEPSFSRTDDGSSTNADNNLNNSNTNGGF